MSESTLPTAIRQYAPRRRKRLTHIVIWAFAATLVGSVMFLHATADGGVQSMVQSNGLSSWAETWWNQGVPEVDECDGWDPNNPEKEDPEGCLRARQYRQTERVLIREEHGEHEHWYFTRQHNIRVLQLLLTCFLPDNHPNHTDCPPKPLILSGWWYTAEVITGATTGEVIWQTGLMQQVKALGMSFIAVGPYENWVTVAEMMPDVYRTIWNSDADTVSCLTDPRCVAKEHYVSPIGAPDISVGVPDAERGVIPIWALNVVDYWGCKPKEHSHNDYWWGLTEDGEWSFQPLGQEWIATPWALPGGHVHLPYSIEEYCLQLPIKPHDHRKDQVLVFAKRSSYFSIDRVAPPHFWTNLSLSPSFDLVSTAQEEPLHPIPPGLVKLGRQSRDQYERLVGDVKVMVGMGAPQISPSVYTALCQATPLVIPYFHEGGKMDGWNLFSNNFQHGPAQLIGEPYVYSYLAQNYTQLESAINRAFATPIERYIPPEMKFEYGLKQMQAYLDRDLQVMFQQVLAKNGGSVPRLVKGARERCIELKRCRDVFAAGRMPSTPQAQDKSGTGMD